MGRSMVETLIGAVVPPEDTSAAVAGAGLPGGNYLAIDPGDGDELIANGGEIKITQPSINLESLLGKLIDSFSGSED